LISNSSPLIFLSKINKLDLLKKMFGFIMITDAVKEEVLINNKPGHFIIEESIKEGWIKIINPKENPDLGLGPGENSVINLAREKKDTLIMDDFFAINTAKAFDIPILRTTSLIFLAVRKKIIAKQKAIYFFNQLIKEGYYISPEIYSILLNRLRRVK